MAYFKAEYAALFFILPNVKLLSSRSIKTADMSIIKIAKLLYIFTIIT